MDTVKIIFDLLKNDKYTEFIKYIQDHRDIDINIRDGAGNYLITYAIIKNKIDVVKILLSRDCKIDMIDQENRSLLYLPIKYGYTDILKGLLEYDKHSVGMSIVDIRDSYGNIPLHYALFTKNIEALDMLLEYHSDVNISDVNLNNSLHLAVKSNEFEICKRILKKDININNRTAIGENALHIACNLQAENIVKLLVEHNIDIDAADFINEFTPLMYAINVNNRNITKLLIDHKANPNMQDFIGNTIVHYAILEENYEILYYLLETQLHINVNIYNLNNELPIHILLSKDNIENTDILEKMIKISNLNFQNNRGVTPLHQLCLKNLWKTYKNILEKKKLNIHIADYDGKTPISYVSKADMPEFLDTATKSYLYILRTRQFTWSEEWQNICSKDINFDNLDTNTQKILRKYAMGKTDTDVCYNIIYENIKKKSYPAKQCTTCSPTIEVTKVEMCSFTGVHLDILFGLVYLLNRYDNACSTIQTTFEKNEELCKYYSGLGLNIKNRCESLNFEIIWGFNRLFFADKFVENFLNCISNKKVRFVIMPLGIEIEKGSHANYLIFDKKTYQLERFEPYGSSAPFKFNYNADLLDNVLVFKFGSIDKTIEYIAPSKYLPKIGFQYFDTAEERTSNISDPGGFCALWSIWYTDMRLKFPDINRKSLVKKLLKEIKRKNISFKNLIRGYSNNITDTRDTVFKNSKISINDWINEQYTQEQHNKIIQETIGLLKK